MYNIVFMGTLIVNRLVLQFYFSIEHNKTKIYRDIFYTDISYIVVYKYTF